MMPMTARAIAAGANQRDASGNSGRQYRKMPNVPTLSSTPTSSAAAPAGAAPPASGSQVWKGKNGALTANAMKNPRNSQRAVLVLMSARTSACQSNVWPPTTQRPITAASMNRPPTSEYRKNFTAAYWRRAPPYEPMMKYIGTSMTSKNT